MYVPEILPKNSLIPIQWGYEKHPKNRLIPGVMYVPEIPPKNGLTIEEW